MGYIVKNNTIKKDPRKVEAILEAPAPENVDELRQFLGMITYYARFIPNLSTITYPLRCLLRQNCQWKWDATCESAFRQLRTEIASDRVLIPYDPHLPILLACDASPTGIAGVLSHIIEGVERPISFASRSLTRAEMNYSQLDREALAIIFAVDKFFMYVYGRKFKLITDNRPLNWIFHHNTKMPTMTAGRLLRYASFLSTFEYEIEHRMAEYHTNVDYFSRVKFKSKTTQEYPLNQEATEIHDQVINQISSTDITYKSIAEETSKDSELAKLKDKLLNESIIDTKFKLQDGIIFKGNRVVIPVIFQKHVLTELHHMHVGVVKMKQLARRYC